MFIMLTTQLIALHTESVGRNFDLMGALHAHIFTFYIASADNLLKWKTLIFPHATNEAISFARQTNCDTRINTIQIHKYNIIGETMSKR